MNDLEVLCELFNLKIVGRYPDLVSPVVVVEVNGSNYQIKNYNNKGRDFLAGWNGIPDVPCKPVGIGIEIDRYAIDI